MGRKLDIAAKTGIDGKRSPVRAVTQKKIVSDVGACFFYCRGFASGDVL